MKTQFICAHISTLLQGSCFHYRESCYCCRDPVFITGISLLVPCCTLYGIAVWFERKIPKKQDRQYAHDQKLCVKLTKGIQKDLESLLDANCKYIATFIGEDRRVYKSCFCSAERDLSSMRKKVGYNGAKIFFVCLFLDQNIYEVKSCSHFFFTKNKNKFPKLMLLLSRA